jgi:hypothetical protein
MTELEWETSADPGLMLTFAAPRLSDRKLRLFLLACCRRLPALLHDERTARAVACAERAAEGPAHFLVQGQVLAREVTEQYAWAGERETPAEDLFHRAATAAWVACDPPAALRRLREPSPGRRSQSLVWAAEGPEQLAHAAAALISRQQAQGETRQAFEYHAERAAQAELLRCIAGNPFVYTVPDPTWRTETVRRIAEGIDRQRAFAQLPMLADALAEAGCDAADVLNHLRSAPDHARGCWVLDLLLDRI